MTPLEAAKRLRDTPPMWEGSNGNPACAVCGGPTYVADGDLRADPIVYTDPEHAPDCPIPSLPAIVAALEALKRTVKAYDKPDDRQTFWQELWALAARLEAP